MKFLSALIALVILITCCINAQTNNWQWVNSCINTTNVLGKNIDIDTNGNVYITGYFEGSINIGNQNFISNGKKDILIVKYDANGNVIWSKQIGGNKDDEGNGIAIDETGVYITGYFSDTAFIDNQLLFSKGNKDVFVVKYDFNGNNIHTKSFGTEYNDIAYSICANNNDGVFVTGDFGEFDGPPHAHKSIQFDSKILTSNGDGDIFILKTDTNFNVQWAKNGGGVFNDYSKAVKSDKKGNVYILGETYTTVATFNQIQIVPYYSGFLINNLFIIKYDSVGNEIWGQEIGGIGPPLSSSNGSQLFSSSLTIDNGNNVIAIGSYYNCDMRFHDSQILTKIADNDIFLVKYNENGNILWTRKAGGLGGDTGLDISVDKSCNIYLTGDFGSNICVFDTINISSLGSYDMYVASYDSSGHVKWVQTSSVTGTETGVGIVNNNTGDNIYITGVFSGQTMELGANTIQNYGSLNIFVAKLFQTTGIANSPEKVGLVVYPNPADDVIFLRSKEPIANIKVYDPMGRLVKEKDNLLQTKEVSMVTKDLAEGIYYVQVAMVDGYQVTEKLLIGR